MKTPPPVGLEPTNFELEVEHASPLRHGGFMSREQGNYCFYVRLNTTLFFLSIPIFWRLLIVLTNFDGETV